jgi:hypothetical protein
MALTLKNLAAGQLTVTTETKVYGYTSSPPAKSALIKNIILTNTSTSQAVTVNVRIKPANGTPLFYLAPLDISIPSKGQLVLDTEITLNLQALDQIHLKASVINVLDYVLNGLERDI